MSFLFLFLFFGYSDHSLRLGRLSAVPLRGFSPPGRLEPVRHRTIRATEGRTEGRTPPPIQEHHQHKEKPRKAFRGCLSVPYFDCFKISPNRTKGNNIKQIIKNIITPPNYAKVKRFVSVVLVYCVAMSGCSFFNAAVSIRELVTVL